MPRGGPRPNSGGARAGAGRKTETLREQQLNKRAQLIQRVTDPDWDEIVGKAIEDAKRGDYVARQWLTPWVMGAPPKDDEPVQRVTLVE